MNVLEGKLTGAEDIKIGIVAARFNEFIVSRLIGGALDGLKRHDVPEEQIDLAWVPGAFEIPVIAEKMAASGKYDAVICLGAVIRGATSHYDYVCSEVSKGIASVSLQSKIPVMFGPNTEHLTKTYSVNLPWYGRLCSLIVFNIEGVDKGASHLSPETVPPQNIFISSLVGEGIVNSILEGSPFRLTTAQGSSCPMDVKLSSLASEKLNVTVSTSTHWVNSVPATPSPGSATPKYATSSAKLLSISLI